MLCLQACIIGSVCECITAPLLSSISVVSRARSGSYVLDSPWKNFESIFKTVWANNANAMSFAYAGTGALKVDFTKTGPAFSSYIHTYPWYTYSKRRLRLQASGLSKVRWWVRFQLGARVSSRKTRSS